MAQYNYPSDGTYSVPFMSSMIDSLKGSYLAWKDARDSYYGSGSEDFIFEKFSEKVVIEQIKKLI